MKRMTGWLYGDERGSVIVLVAVLMLALLGISALVIDGGYLFESRRQLVTTADAAAVAGATEFASYILSGRTSTEAADAAKLRAEEYAQRNGVTLAQTQVVVDEASRIVTVVVGKTEPLFFARLLGSTTADTGAHAAAITGPISSVTNDADVMPILVTEDVDLGVALPLREATPPSIGAGNFSALALGGTGANNYLTNLINGYQGTLIAGQTYVDTETGNIPNKTLDGIMSHITACGQGTSCYVTNTSGAWVEHFNHPVDGHCPRKVKLLVCDFHHDEATGKDTILVLGFLSFLIDNVIKDGGNVTIYGTSYPIIATGQVSGGGGGGSGGDYGTWAVNLIQ